MAVVRAMEAMGGGGIGIWCGESDVGVLIHCHVG